RLRACGPTEASGGVAHLASDPRRSCAAYQTRRRPRRQPAAPPGAAPLARVWARSSRRSRGASRVGPRVVVVLLAGRLGSAPIESGLHHSDVVAAVSPLTDA